MRLLELGHFKNGKLKNILVKERFLLLIFPCHHIVFPCLNFA